MACPKRCHGNRTRPSARGLALYQTRSPASLDFIIQSHTIAVISTCPPFSFPSACSLQATAYMKRSSQGQIKRPETLETHLLRGQSSYAVGVPRRLGQDLGNVRHVDVRLGMFAISAPPIGRQRQSLRKRRPAVPSAQEDTHTQSQAHTRKAFG